MEDYPPLLQNLETPRHLREGACRLAQACTGAHGPRSLKPSALGGGFPVGKDDRSGRTRERGFDGGKKVKGRKRRHLLVDTQGCCSKPCCPQRQSDGLRGDQDAPFKGPTEHSLAFLTCGWRRATAERARVQIGCVRPWVGAWMWCSVRRSPPPKRCFDGVGEGVGQRGRKGGVGKVQATSKGFVVLPRRWVVERTIAWVDHNRRMSKDYERLRRARKPSSTWR
jgi:transposase